MIANKVLQIWPLILALYILIAWWLYGAADGLTLLALVLISLGVLLFWIMLLIVEDAKQ